MLLDTSGLLPLVLPDAPQHKLALEIYAAATERTIHTFVTAEFIALATARGIGRRQILDFVHDLENSAEVHVVFVDIVLYRQALDLLRKRLDKTWSLCDAVSFVLMERLKIQEALTSDHHFVQAGFRALL